MVEIIKDIEIKVNKNNVKRIFKINKRSSVNNLQKISGLLEKALSIANNCIRPKIVFELLKIKNIDNSTIIAEKGFKIKTKKMLPSLQGCNYVVPFVLTIGGLLETEIDKIQSEGKTTLSYIIDVIGSEAAELTAEFLSRSLTQRANKIGLNVTLRFSPGYCDWKLDAQRDIFKLLKPSRIGVKLLPSLMMYPNKSISGIIGLGRGKHISISPCKYCSIRKVCPYSR